MATTYYLKVHIESMGTELTTGDTPKSRAGHMCKKIKNGDRYNSKNTIQKIQLKK